MLIKENKNLKYDKIPKVIGFPEDYDKLELDPRVCILERFERINDRLGLYFKNSSQASIIAKNIEGGREMDLIEKRLESLTGKSYEEILDIDFK